MKKIATILAVFAILALPVVAFAQGSGGDAYTEDVPGPGGNPPSNEGGNDDPLPGDTQSLPADTQSVPADTQSDFAAEGDDGAAAANLAQPTSPDGKAPNDGGVGAGQTASGNSGSDGSGSDSGFGEAVVELVGDSDDGMGLLPIILGSVLVGAVAFVITRRSGGSTGSA